MATDVRKKETELATLLVISPKLLEIRYNTGIVFNNDALSEVQAMRRTLMGDRSYATLTIIPEDVDYRMDVMEQDHGELDRSTGRLLATAIVVHASMIKLLTKLYLSYFPQPHRVLVTDNEEAARRWLSEQLQEIERTGS